MPLSAPLRHRPLGETIHCAWSLQVSRKKWYSSAESQVTG